MEMKNKNNIIKIILKAILYIIFVWYWYASLISLTTGPFILLAFLTCLNEKLSEIVSNNFDILFIISICSPFASYLLAKLFGIFKFVDNLKTNIFGKLFILTLIAILSSLILIIRFKYVENEENMAYHISACILTLVPAYFLYKGFGYLTKKYPKPFEKIGYYCSIEFWKKVALKIFNIE